MNKAFVQALPRGSAAYVLAHGVWQSGRGRKPSEPFREIRNPSLAWTEANGVLQELAAQLTEAVSSANPLVLGDFDAPEVQDKLLLLALLAGTDWFDRFADWAVEIRPALFDQPGTFDAFPDDLPGGIRVLLSREEDGSHRLALAGQIGPRSDGEPIIADPWLTDEEADEFVEMALAMAAEGDPMMLLPHSFGYQADRWSASDLETLVRSIERRLNLGVPDLVAAIRAVTRFTEMTDPDEGVSLYVDLDPDGIAVLSTGSPGWSPDD